jgi:hypothetical protein
MADHVEQRVANGEGDVLGVIDAVPGDRDAGSPVTLGTAQCLTGDGWLISRAFPARQPAPNIGAIGVRSMN